MGLSMCQAPGWGLSVDELGSWHLLLGLREVHQDTATPT